MKIDLDPSIFDRVQRTEWSLLGALPVNREQIARLLSRPERYWREVKLQKSSGGFRVCYCPVQKLSLTQLKIMEFLRKDSLCGISPFATAFEKGSSIIRNAQAHRHNRSSLVLDLRDAFASVSRKHVYRRLKRLSGISVDTAWVWSRLLTFRGCIRQGSRISPSLFNMMMENFDRSIATEICHLPTRVVYTRYGDDLCFSTPLDEFPREIEEKIRETVSTLHFRLNTKRKEGRNGALQFPGVYVYNGRVQPTDDVIQEWSSLGLTTSVAVRQGYRSYFNQFSRSARRHVKDRRRELVD